MNGWIIFGYWLLGIASFLVLGPFLLVFIIYRYAFIPPISIDVNKPSRLLGSNFHSYVQESIMVQEEIWKRDFGSFFSRLFKDDAGQRCLKKRGSST